MSILTRKEAPWSPEEIDYLTRNLSAGYTYSQIAEGLGRPRNSVAGKIRRLRGAKDKPRVRPAKSRVAAAKMHVANGERQDQVAELLADGLDFDDIADELNVTVNAVKQAFKKICRKMGMQAE